MTHSVAQPTTLTCPACRRPFPAEVWLIVDTAERPDLLARMRAGTLHDLPCPHCHHAGSGVDAPLLIYRPGQTPPILFSTAQDTNAEEDQEQANALLGWLAENLGRAWQDAWLDGIAMVRREVLSVYLSDGPDAANQALAEETAGVSSLGQTIQTFISADTWDESQWIVEQHRELLSDEADTLFEQLIEAAQTQEDDDDMAVLEDHRTLLRRCREAGIPRAFAEKMLPPEGMAEAERLGLAPEEFLAQMRAAEEMPPGLREVLAELAASGIEVKSGEDLGRALAERPDLRAKLEAAMPSRGGGFDIPPEFSGDFQQAQEAEQRYRRTNNQAALDAAAAAWEHILSHPAFSAADARFQLAAMNNAGGVFLRRYWARGRLADLNRALDLWQTAVQRTPPDSPDLPGYLNNLGTGLSARYAATGQLADLAEAIRVSEQAVQRTPPDSPDLPGYLNNLGTGLRDRYARTGQLADLAEAIRVSKQALKATPPDSPDLPSLLNNLGTGLRDRYARTGQLADLAEAIRVYEQAVQATPPDSPDRPSRLNNLGTGLSDRYAATGQLADLAEAIRVSEQAVQRTPPDSPDLPGYLNNLGTGLSDRYARTGQLADLAEAQKHYERACRLGLVVALEETLRSARNWGKWALGRHAWEEAITAYDFGRQAIAQLFQSQLDRPAKESWLKEAQGLPANAAYALAQLDRLPEAIVALEQGRTRLLAEALEQSRRDLQRLPALGHGDLYERYRAASGRLTALQQQAGQPASAGPDHPAGPRNYAAWRQALEEARRDLDETIAAIRSVSVDGQQPYADFLLPPTFARIAAAVQPGVPLVYLLTTEPGGLALILHRPDAQADAIVSQIRLDRFTAQDLDALLIERQGDQITGGYLPGQLGDHAWLTQHLDQTLTILGGRLIGPLATALRRGPFRGARASQRALTLVPAGRLSLLPLHAACYPVNGATRRFLDDFTVTYVPSIMTLADVQTRPTDAHGPLLAIGNPLPHHHPAWFTDWLAQEVSAAHPGGTLLLHAAATAAATDAALAAAPAHVLFACHGGFDPTHPLDSGLELANGPQQPYTVRHLLDNVRFSAAPLVTLCACQTSITDFNNIPDEAVGLPAAFLQAGARHVVATFWSVEALPTVLLVRQFYRYLDAGQPVEVALTAAVRWLRQLDILTYQVELASMRRTLDDPAAFVLDWQASRLDGPTPFAAPHYWAAFACHGPLTV